MRRILILVSAAACTAGPLEVSADEPLPPELAAGDIVRAGDIAIEVPEPGEIAAISVERDDGTGQELVIENRDGTVAVVTQPDDPLVLAAGSHDPCQDGAYKLMGHHWTTDYAWRFEAGSTPSANSKDNVETGLIHAANAITNSRNDCGLDDRISATNTYVGRTTKAPNIRATTTTVTCGSRDQTSVVGFAPLPSAYLAVACTWSDGNHKALEGDVRISTRHAFYALDVPGGCSHAFGIEPTATHEFGHVFGLAHVSESEHPLLTMSPSLTSCSNASLTLGLGDVRGLRSIY